MKPKKCSPLSAYPFAVFKFRLSAQLPVAVVPLLVPRSIRCKSPPSLLKPHLAVRRHATPPRPQKALCRPSSCAAKRTRRLYGQGRPGRFGEEEPRAVLLVSSSSAGRARHSFGLLLWPDELLSWVPPAIAAPAATAELHRRSGLRMDLAPALLASLTSPSWQLHGVSPLP